MADIQFSGVTKRYPDGTLAVDALDLEIADGEFMILVGPSGCGKSTALRMVAGLEEISEGELRIGGERVNDVAPKNRDIAMVFQNYALYANMTVRDNMGFALRVAKHSKAEIAQRVEEAARILDLTDHLDRKPARLSGGQRQRVAMGRAIVREPRAFLMDEPLSNLDAKLRVQMRTEIARITQRLDTTTLYVTHDQTEAMTLGDRVAVMRHGIVQQVGTPEQLYEHPANAFVAGFVGSPPMSFLPARVDGEQLVLPFARLELDSATRAALGGRRAIVAGIRCEDLSDRPAASCRNPQQIDVVADVVERLGAESYAYFQVEGDVELDQLQEVAEGSAAGITKGQVVARLDGRSSARAGDRLGLWLDPERLYLFDETDGTSLRAAAA